MGVEMMKKHDEMIFQGRVRGRKPIKVVDERTPGAVKVRIRGAGTCHMMPADAEADDRVEVIR